MRVRVCVLALAHEHWWEKLASLASTTDLPNSSGPGLRASQPLPLP